MSEPEKLAAAEQLEKDRQIVRRCRCSVLASVPERAELVHVDHAKGW